MLGNTNAIIIGNAVQTEKINLTITSNQAESNDLIGVRFVIVYGFEGEYAEPYTWEGKPITLDIPQYVTYIIMFGEVSGYKTPENIVFTAVPDNVRQINVEYQTEVVTVTVSADSGAAVSGQTVTINGVTTTLPASGIVSQKVPYGTSYSVSVNDKDGYEAPVAQTFTAGQVSRSVSMVYEEIKLGVFIQDTTGKLWTSDAWNGSATPNGVAVLTSACSFVIALSEKSNIPIDSVGYSNNMNLTIYSSTSNAIKDYSGSSNTTAMVSAYGNDTSEAAGYCRNFTFPNGKKGYLGSAGEWQVAYDNQSAIMTCMSKAGGTAIGSSNYYWSSTRAHNYDAYDETYGDYSINRFWYLTWRSGSWSVAQIGARARPFTTL